MANLISFVKDCEKYYDKGEQKPIFIIDIRKNVLGI